jgi:hypothetical protein
MNTRDVRYLGNVCLTRHDCKRQRIRSCKQPVRVYEPCWSRMLPSHGNATE